LLDVEGDDNDGNVVKLGLRILFEGFRHVAAN